MKRIIKTKKSQKQRLQEAYDIHASFHCFMGYVCCDDEGDLLAFRKWVLKRERKAIERTIINKVAKRELELITKMRR